MRAALFISRCRNIITMVRTNKQPPNAAKDILELFRQIAADPLLAAARELDQAMEHTRRVWVLLEIDRLEAQSRSNADGSVAEQSS
jgi:hypothetical protein